MTTGKEVETIVIEPVQPPVPVEPAPAPTEPVPV